VPFELKKYAGIRVPGAAITSTKYSLWEKDNWMKLISRKRYK
jgi:hypothetical protein